MKRNFMNSKTAKRLKTALAILCVIACIGTTVFALVLAKEDDPGQAHFFTTATFSRITDEEEDFEDMKICPVLFETYIGENTYTMTVEYSYEEWEALPEDATVTGYIYIFDNELVSACFPHEATAKELKAAVRNSSAQGLSVFFGAAMALALLAVGFGVMTLFGKFFTDYEQLWFLSILVLAAVFSLLFPEEEANGVNGLIIMALYLADTFLNILCELLISKQSKWNFIVSVFVELTEIAICLVLAYRFATMATTLLFWLPVDIISFINWHKHPDREEEELTVVRTLKGWQEVAIIAGIIVWTVGVGYFLTTLDFGSDFFKNRTIEVIVCYMDACVSAVGIVNGLFILFRLREQWIAWYIDAILEGVINILSGQYVLLILKLGYLTNTTYGYIKWTKYIKAAEEKRK